MKVFLTGGTGFIGSHIAEKLLESGYEVRALVRATSDVEHLKRLGVELVQGALGSAGEFRDQLRGCDAVIHGAGILASGQPEWMYQVNAQGTRDLVDEVAAVAEPGTPFVYISSVAAQGPSQGRAAREVGEVPQPVSYYGRTKLDGEGAVLAHREKLATSILRPPPVYGPRDRDMFQVFAMANRRLTPVMGRGERLLSVIHVEDVARAAVLCVERGARGVYAVDDGHCYTWREMVGTIAEGVGKRSLTVPVPRAVFAGAAAVSEVYGRLSKRSLVFDRDKYLEMIQESWVCGYAEIQRDLGWEPKWSLLEGAKQTAAWYREQGWL